MATGEVSGGEKALEEFGYQQELKRSLRLRDLVIYGLVFMVPIAPFSIFGVVFNASQGMVPLTYLIGMVAMIFTALSYREMSRAFPIAGSVYSYVSRGVHPIVGFFAGWAILLDYLLVPTLLYIIGAAALNPLIPAVPQWLWVVVFVVFNTIVNYLGIESTARLNRIFLVAELIVLAIFVVVGIIAISRGVNGAHFSLQPFFRPEVATPSLIFGALSVAVLSFLGFDAISTLSEEVRGDRKVVGRATVASLILVAVLFIVQTYVASLLVPTLTSFPAGDKTNTAFYDVARIAGGAWLMVTVAVASALASAVANSMAAQAATSRLLFSMARDGRLFRFLAHVNPRRKVPERAVLVVGGISLVFGLAAVSQVGLVSQLVNFGALFSFLLLHFSVAYYYLRRERSRNWWLHLAVPALGFVIIAYVLVNADILAKIGGLVWLFAGGVVALVLVLRGRTTDLKLDD
ncbi:APC family permease [Fodinicola acaciae]|uniref:APC family permease n=1 Tax=Fodinicola acaciae TaxID=2681555 RepID=UPI0013D268DF|nr:APC family permease [Fodinicola acaciae]